MSLLELFVNVDDFCQMSIVGSCEPPIVGVSVPSRGGRKCASLRRSGWNAMEEKD